MELFEGSIAEALHLAMRERGATLALAESCTGGAIAARLISFPGASEFFLGSMVVYSNAWKERLLGVSSKTLKTKGAVSRETVEEMVRGLLERTEADYVAAVSGIAGPSGGTAEKPVGTLYIAVAKRGGEIDAGRVQAPQNRLLAIEYAVDMTLTVLWRRIVHNKMTLCYMN
jgi:nicotinamide-nucleotide amidase